MQRSQTSKTSDIGVPIKDEGHCFYRLINFRQFYENLRFISHLVISNTKAEREMVKGKDNREHGKKHADIQLQAKSGLRHRTLTTAVPEVGGGGGGGLILTELNRLRRLP
jgi:hypothetical protein